MTLYRLDASIRVEGSHSRALADIVEQEWTAAHPGDTVIRRHIGTEPVPATAWPLAVQALMAPPEEERTPDATRGRCVGRPRSRSAPLGRRRPVRCTALQLRRVPALQDVGGPRDHRSPHGRGSPATAGTPAVLAAVRGGFYGAGTPREGWDHATGWMTRILADVWKFDLEVVEQEFTLVGVNPALDEFKEMAVELRIKAEETALERGRNLVARGLVSQVQSG